MNAEKKPAELGAFRERITLQALFETLSATGDPDYSYSDLASVWAKIEPVSARERTQGGRIVARGVYDVTIRYRAGLNSAMRAVWANPAFPGPKYLAFTDMINPDRQRVFLKIRMEDLSPDAGAT